MLYYYRDTMDKSEKKKKKCLTEGDSTMLKNIRENSSLKAFRHKKTKNKTKKKNKTF